MNADVANGGNADNNNNNNNNNNDNTEDKEKVRGKCKKGVGGGEYFMFKKKLNEPFLLTVFR
jgi:hypothetical protein